jgi:hypothetical protein
MPIELLLRHRGAVVLRALAEAVKRGDRRSFRSSTNFVAICWPDAGEKAAVLNVHRAFDQKSGI